MFFKGGSALAVLSEESKRQKMIEENIRALALHKKRDAVAQKEFSRKKIMTKKFEEEKDSFINPKLLDFVDLDDCFRAIERKPALEDQFGKLTEKDRLILFAELKKDLKFYALGEHEKFAIDEEASIGTSKLAGLVDERNANIQECMHSHVPIYTEYTCSCCGEPKPITSFYRSWSVSDAARLDDKSLFHKPICIDCCKRVFEYYYLKEYNKDARKAMERYCAETNTYWDENVFDAAVHQQGAHGGERHIVSEYATMLAVKQIYRGYWDSPDRVATVVYAEPPVVPAPIASVPTNTTRSDDGVDTQDTPDINFGIKKPESSGGWTAADKKNRNKVYKLFGYDPFSHISNEDELKRVYKDFLNILDDDMEGDLVKLQAAAQIVASYSRIRGIDAEYERKIQAQAGADALKKISELKAKELKAISDFAKDNGFSERFATAKSKGENTFTGILNRMNNSKFENAAINGYDILTSKSIQEVADASFSAIFQQLSLGEADMWKISQQQLEELIKLRSENEDLKEKIRKAEYKAAEAKLVYRAKQEQLSEAEDVT